MSLALGSKKVETVEKVTRRFEERRVREF